MASADILMNIDGQPYPRYTQDAGSYSLQRNAYFTNSNSYSHFGRYGTQQDCDAQGFGYTFNNGSCYFPCPDSYLQDATNPRECDPRPILSKADVYYELLGSAVMDCAKLIPAYKDLVAEHNNDPTQVGFPAGSGCENPFPSPPVFPFDPVGVYDTSSSDGDPLKPLDAPLDANGGTATQTTPTIVAPSDPSGLNKTLPRNRLIVTIEEIDRMLKVNDFGVASYSGLASRLIAEPTFLDTNPSYLLEFQIEVPDFQWEITITPEEYALLPEVEQCAICMDYGSLYTNPAIITQLRLYAPTITMTRNAPLPDFPTFGECPQAKKEIACSDKVENGGPCRWVGGCGGNCKCPEASSKEGTVGPQPSSGGGETAIEFGGLDTNTLLFIGGGLAVAYFMLS